MTGVPGVSPVQELRQIRARLAVLANAASEAEAIDLLREAEQCKAALSAMQACQTAVLEALRHNAEALREVPASRRGKGLGAEVGLARMVSPTRGARHLANASMLLTDLPNTYTALSQGRIREEHAYAVAAEVTWLAKPHRQRVDALLADQFDTLGPRQLAGKARFHAQRLDQQGAVDRLAKAASQRRVTVRPAPEGMAYLTALLPLPQAVGACAGLSRAATTMVVTGDTTRDLADPTGTSRTRDQIMADLLVQRLTGQSVAAAVPAEVQVVMTDTALFGTDPTPAWIPGHGPLPAMVAKSWLAHPEAAVFLRRVFTRPEDHQLVGLDSQARGFPAGLRRMVVLRDDVCRTPYCGAAIQQVDHIHPVRQGGPTHWSNASGLCAGCNQIKENTGWSHTGDPAGLTVTTPTGHTYQTPVGPLLPVDDLPDSDTTAAPPDNGTDRAPPKHPDGDDSPPSNTIATYRERTWTITQRITQTRAA